MEPGKGFKTVIFDIKDRAGDCSIKLNSGESLGLVQAVTIKARVGELSTATIETICNQAEVEILQRNTEVVLIDNRKRIENKILGSLKTNFTLEEILTLIKE